MLFVHVVVSSRGYVPYLNEHEERDGPEEQSSGHRAVSTDAAVCKDAIQQTLSRQQQ